MSNSELLFQANEMLTVFSREQVPLMGFCTPTVVAIDDKACTIAIPLNHNTTNHLGCMYFGALHVGADCAGGLLAMHQIQKRQQNISLIFKNVHAEFLRRAEGDVHFRCTSGEAIAQAIDQIIRSKERINIPIHVVATVPSISPHENVAEFALTLSMKVHE